MVTKKTTPKKAPARPSADKPKRPEPHEIVLSSNALNAAVMSSWSKFAGDVDLQALADDLGEQTRKVQDGDMRPIEGMLFRQAKTLETMFTSLSRRAAAQENLKQFQTHLTLAMKAQAQCRATLEALAEIKNPKPVTFVKQANMAQGHQQVNNTYARASSSDGIPSSPVENFQSEPNKLLAEQNAWSVKPVTMKNQAEIKKGVIL
uniref:Uncharacterized protein n=1 Tax=Polaromonas sp. H8N TaxID=1840297 RepID=A0A2S1FID0_9BURK|nr:hypothetical protein [Polaromonas sp. H8N]AWD72271.1 hypothetical protein pH8NP1_p010 [Polaromonas sp. H8N]